MSIWWVGTVTRIVCQNKNKICSIIWGENRPKELIFFKKNCKWSFLVFLFVLQKSDEKYRRASTTTLTTIWPAGYYSKQKKNGEKGETKGSLV